MRVKATSERKNCGKNSAFSCRLYMKTANYGRLFTAPFSNMRISQPTIAFFAAVNHLILTNLLGNKTLLHGFKRSWFVICGFRSVLCFSVSRFVACDRNYDWRQRKTQLWRWLLKVCEKRSKVSVQSQAPGSGGINGQLAVCFSILLVFIQYNISV